MSTGVTLRSESVSNEVVVSNRTQVIEFNDEQLALIKSTVARDTTNDQLSLFLYTCKRSGLDPLARQIYCVVDKKGRMTIQTAIDGYRLIADRTGKYAGQVGPFWCGGDGVWQDVWLKKTPPAAAKVGVLKSNFKEPLWGIANFEDYAQKYPDGNLTHAWAKMPSLMIAKCAESLALRKAFPQELSGILTSDEMQQADNQQQERALPNNLTPEALKSLQREIEKTEALVKHNENSVEYGNHPEIGTDEEFPFEKVISDKQRKRLFAISKAANWTQDEVKELILKETGQESSAAIPWTKYDSICKTIESNPVT